MSEIVTGASDSGPSSSSTSPTPSSTADIAASVIADMDGGGDNGGQSLNGDTVKATPTAAEKITVTDEDDFDAVPKEITDSLGRKRVNSIPHPRVEQMIKRRENKLIATVAKELGITKAEAELQLDDVLGGLKERGTKLTAAEARIQQVEAVEGIMANDPERFLQLMVQVNPAYQRFLQQQGQQAAQAQPQPQVDDDPEPQPDYDLGDGRMTYSLDGLKKRDAWKERQIVKKLEGTLAERMKPVEDRFKQDQEREKAQRQFQERAEVISKSLERARQWPQFKENEDAILAALKADTSKTLTLTDAYMQTVMPKLAGDRTKIRQEVLAEINSQPKTTSVATTPAPSRPDKPKSTADIAREIMAQMGGGN